MLQGEERVRSFAHRKLRRNRRFQEVESDDEKLPSQLDGEIILRVYTDTRDNQLFITVRGIYADSLGTFVAYEDMVSLSTNVETLGKLKANQIHIELKSGETLSLLIHGENVLVIDGHESPTNDIWTIYTFLLKVYGR